MLERKAKVIIWDISQENIDETLSGFSNKGDVFGYKVDVSDDSFKGVEAIIQSMTLAERKNPDLINGSRRKRIADGSGKNISDVNQLMKQFDDMRKMMKTMNKMQAGGKPMRGMPFGMKR